MRLLSVVKSFFLMLILLVALYGGAAVIGSLIPVNQHWVESADGVQIYVVSNGYHTGIVVPTAAAGTDLSLIFRATDLADPRDAGNFLIFGWGDRDFYLNTPEWRDVRPGIVLTALAGSGRTLLHVDHLRAVAEVPDARRIILSAAEYRRLIEKVMETLKLDRDGRPVAVPGYGRLDIFYEARGDYNLMRTCNVWTAETLSAAGVKTGWWTPFSGGVMWWFQPAPATIVAHPASSITSIPNSVAFFNFDPAPGPATIRSVLALTDPDVFAPRDSA